MGNSRSQNSRACRAATATSICRAAAWIILAGIIVLSLAGCQGATHQVLPAQATRTPKPTFTPTAQVGNDGAAPAAAARLEATPTPTAAIEEPAPSPTPTRKRRESVALAQELPTPTPAAQGYSSPAAARVPKTGKAILIDQDRQHMYLFEDGVEIRAIPCSTGDPANHGTRAWEGVVGDYVGTFQSYGTYSDYAWYLFEDRGSILIHGAPYVLTADGRREYQDLDALGRWPNSHGCIRIHPDEARWFTFWDPKGVPIIITPWTGGRPLSETPDH